MAIAFINGGSANINNGGNPSLDVSSWGLAEDDLVICAVGIGDNDNVDFTMAMITTGYTLVPGTDLFSNDTQDSHLGVFYKFQTATPDTTVSGDGQGGTDASTAIAVIAFSGVDTTTPFDVTSTVATGLNTYAANPPSIDHNGTAGIWTVIAAAAGTTRGASAAFTFPTNYTTNAAQGRGNDTSDVTVGLGYNAAPSDPEDPAVFAHSGTDSTAFSWCAATMALRAAAGTETPQTVAASVAAVAGVVKQTAHPLAATDTPIGLVATAITFASTLAASVVAVGAVTTANIWALTLSAVGSVGPAMVRQAGKVLAGVVAAPSTFVKAVSKTVTATATPVGLISASLTFFQTVAASVVAVAAVSTVKIINLTLAAVVAAVATVTKAVAFTLAGVGAAVAGLTKGMAWVVTALASSVAAIGTVFQAGGGGPAPTTTPGLIRSLLSLASKDVKTGAEFVETVEPETYNKS